MSISGESTPPQAKNARFILPGDIIRYDSVGRDPVEEVVRSVDVVLNMANGQTITAERGQLFTIIPPGEFAGLTPEELVAFEQEIDDTDGA